MSRELVWTEFMTVDGVVDSPAVPSGVLLKPLPSPARLVMVDRP